MEFTVAGHEILHRGYPVARLARITQKHAEIWIDPKVWLEWKEFLPEETLKGLLYSMAVTIKKRYPYIEALSIRVGAP